MPSPIKAGKGGGAYDNIFPCTRRSAMSAAMRALYVALLLAAGASPALAGCKDDPAPKVDWHGCNRQMLQLDGSDLTGANLAGAFLSGSRLSGAKLAGANLQRSELIRTVADGADLTGATFEKALASRTSFKQAILKNAHLDRAEFQRV